MIRLYTGEYLLSPFVLHFGMNRCSHGCVYCFANLNRPDRRGDANDLLKIARWYESGSTCIEFEAMRAGHPVLVANDSDPCALSNAPTFGALHDASRQHGFRLVYQTRGGDAEAEARIVSDDPTCVYVSLTTDRDDIVKEYEPGCPTFSRRLDFIRRLRQRGHMVIVGLNPFIPSWWSDIEGALSALAALGVQHIWHQPLHLSRFQVAAMPESVRLKKSEFVDYGMKRVEPQAREYRAAMEVALDKGFNLLRGGVSERLGFWDDYFELGFPFFPTLDAFVRDCDARAGGDPLLVTLQGFHDWANVFDKPRSIYKEYLVKIGRSVRNLGEKTESARSMLDVHRFLWRIEDFNTPFRLNAFARAAHDGGWAADESGALLLAVSAEAFEGPEVPASGLQFLDSPLERR